MIKLKKVKPIGNKIYLRKIIYKIKSKGYKSLIEEKKIHFIEDIKYKFENEFNTSSVSLFKDYDLADKKSIISVTSLNYILSKNFNQFVLFSYGLNKVIFFPAPNSIIKFINNLGYFRINKTISKILWFCYKFKFFLSGSYELLKIFNYIFLKKKNFSLDNNKYDKVYYLSSMGEGNFNFDTRSYNCITWLYNNFISTKNYKSVLLVHSNSNNKNFIKFKNLHIIYSRYPFLDINKNSNIFIVSSILKFYLKCLFNIFKNKYDFQIILMKQHLISIASNYFKASFDIAFFNNSDYLSRPLWTFNKNKNLNIFFYFYSTNYLKLKKNNNNIKFAVGYKSMSWPNYIFWNKTQSKHFSTLNKHNSIIINEPVSFSDNVEELRINQKFKKIVSLFNVQPLNFQSYIDYCLYDIDDYYRDKICINFYKQLISFFDKNILILIKEKRSNPNVSENYLNFSKKISQLDNVKFINNNISPYKLIYKSDLVISIPFSSASIMAKYCKINSYYYDPSNMLNQNDSPFKIKILNKLNIKDIL